MNNFDHLSPNIAIEHVTAKSLKPWPGNARTHSTKQIKQLTKSIEEFGFTNPILIDDHDSILAGHGRVLAAKKLGMKLVPCLRLSNLSEMQKRAYVLADNKLALNAGWDEDLLAAELEALLATDVDFDVELTGFSIAETDLIIESAAPEDAGDPADDNLPAPEALSKVCRTGDIWQLGKHRLICGDALDSETVLVLMDGGTADMVFTDPPYNVQIDGNVCGLGAVKHREFAMASGEMSADQFIAFLSRSFKNMASHSKDGAIHFICMDWRHIRELQAAGEGVYSELKNLIVWAKDNGGMGTFYRSRHELIFAYKVGSAPHTNTFGLGEGGRYRTNVWNYRGMSSRSAARMEELKLHPTVKPVQMVADAIKDVSKRNGIVLDLFGGSGSTLIAAEKTGRRAYLAELEPHYCSIIIQRWENYAHDDAVLISAHDPNRLSSAA